MFHQRLHHEKRRALDLTMTSFANHAGCTDCTDAKSTCGSSRRASTRLSHYTGCHDPSCDQTADNSEAEDDTLLSLDHDVESVTSDETNGITEKDFGAMPPRRAFANRRSGIQSVRQSMIEPVLRRPRWFESEENIAFEFRLASRGKMESGAKGCEAAYTGSAASSTTRKPPGRVPIRELGNDSKAWQRLLTSALFLVKEDDMPLNEGDSAMLDLGLVGARQTGGKHLAMQHQTREEYKSSVASDSDPAKRIQWRVVIKPAQRREKGVLLPR